MVPQSRRSNARRLSSEVSNLRCNGRTIRDYCKLRCQSLTIVRPNLCRRDPIMRLAQPAMKQDSDNRLLEEVSR